MPAKLPGLRQNNRKAWEVWVILDSWQQSVTAPHLLPTSKIMPKPTFKNHHCSETQSTQKKPVRWQVAAQPSSAHFWTPKHRHSNPLNHSQRGYSPLTQVRTWKVWWMHQDGELQSQRFFHQMSHPCLPALQGQEILVVLILSPHFFNTTGNYVLIFSSSRLLV